MTRTLERIAAMSSAADWPGKVLLLRRLGMTWLEIAKFLGVLEDDARALARGTK
jgi:hypothetical protein